MKKKTSRLLIIAVIIGLAVCFRFFMPKGDDPCDFPNRNHVNELVYSNHARCRMDCRQVTEALVQDVYLHGEVNCDKSGEQKGEMRYALESKDPASQDRIRLVIAEDTDDNEHVVVTVIRLDKKFDCYCN